MVKRRKYLIITIITILYWGGCIFNNLEKQKERERKMKSWKTEFIEHNIRTISIMVTSENHGIEGRRGQGWVGVDKVYVNNILINSDSLYRKYDFFQRVCGKYYFLSYKMAIDDSIVIKFPPIDRYEVYKVKDYSPYYTVKNCYPRWNLQDRKFLKYLPKCNN